MKECVFCQIVSGKLPAYRIYEDNDFLAFLDINPRVLGHTLVIPKIHYRWVYDVPKFTQYWRVVSKITQAMKRALKPHFISYVTHGLEIPHAHIHLMPRKINETEFVPSIKYFSEDEMNKVAELIRKEI
ncbi:MAG: HIT family protein [Microgenomates group bacterium]